MKRLSILFVGLLSAVLIFSVVSLADDYDSADVDITFNDALVLRVSDDPIVFNIDQSDLETAGAGEGGLTEDENDFTASSGGTVSVDVWSLTNYELGVSFMDENDNTTDKTGLFEIQGGNANATSSTDIPWLNHSEGTGPANVNDHNDPSHVQPNVLKVKTGTSEWPSADSSSYTVTMDLYHADKAYNNADFHIDFWAYEGTIGGTASGS